MSIDIQNILLRARTPKQLSATGDIYAEGQRGAVTVLALTAAAAAATATIKTGGSGGTTVATIAAPIGTTVPIQYPSGLGFNDGLHVTLTGVGALFDAVGTSETAPA